VPELQDIEKDVTQLLQETFSETTVHLKAELPDVKRLLADIDVDIYDGVLTTYARKGHGLQRCLSLSLLRALAKKIRDGQQNKLKRPIIILFEEPELFLHPSAQDQMREALVQISKQNQVVIATHSPSMVSVGTLKQLVLVKKIREPIKDGAFGFATVKLAPNRIEAADHNEKDLLSILNLHRSSRVFFANRVLLVEGPSDVHLLNAIGERLKMGRLESRGCTIIEIGGKDKIKTAQDILASLGIEAFGLVDLDFVWRGAGCCLKEDGELSQFCQKLVEQTKGVEEKKISEEKRRLVKSDAGLSKSSKGDYVQAASEIFAGTRTLLYEPELLKIFNTFVGKALKR
jgi:putative ATP-dependent endonuclease of OLD family